MQQRPFKQVDVFTDQAYLGNPLAVVLDGLGLSTEEMQHFARWTNLSETTFVLPPTPEAAARGADYQVRIFTTAYEMPFAGHPTLGTCHAWLEHGGVPQSPGMVVQECKVGLVKISRDSAFDGRAAFAAPALKRQEATPALVQALADALGIARSNVQASQHLNNGPSHFGLLLDSADTVLALAPDFSRLRSVLAGAGISGVGVAALQPGVATTGLIARSNREARAFVGSPSATPSGTAEDAGLEVRFFFDHGNGVGEDPVTGSFNASLAQWLIAQGLAPQRYTASQGTCIGVQGRVHVHRDAAGQVWVGGDAVTCINGTVRL